MSKDLPSYEEFAEDNSNLPSIDDFITDLEKEKNKSEEE